MNNVIPKTAMATLGLLNKEILKTDEYLGIAENYRHMFQCVSS